MAVKTATAVGARIQQARQMRGLSQEELAERIGVTQTAISYWEKGRRSPDVEDLVGLAEALEIDVGAFFTDASARRPTRAVLRAQASRALLDELADVLDDFVGAAEELPVPVRELRVTSEAPLSAARELLASSGEKYPPVRVERLAQRCGVRVLEWDFDGAISGVLLDLESAPVIGFDSSDFAGRQRFTIGHELGHYLLRHVQNFHIDLASPAAHGHPLSYDWRDERAANEFSAELLMPAAAVAAELEKLKTARKLAKKFDVSPEAMGYRLTNLSLH